MQGTITMTKADPVTIHTYTAPEAGWRATSHLVELSTQLLLVDTPLRPDLAREVLDHAQSVGKPISRLYISHAHPDHYATACLVDAPAYALAEVRERIAQVGSRAIPGAYLLTGNADIQPPAVRAIDHVLEPGEEVIDGVRFRFESVGPAEVADQLVISLPEQAVLIVQDLVYNDVHAFLGERRFDEWIAALTALEARPHDVVLPGHGLPGDRRVYGAARAYLTVAKAAHAEAEGPDDLNARLVDAYPDHTGTAMQPVQNYYLYPTKATP
jgi:glyoxylase-like metal-dependent hydrolase (beta-lactamase superfamily II)